jgi:putative spermidine/putrescine transport system ATP-binding protein
MAIVEINDVSKSYGDVVAVSRMSLLIAHGEFVALLGPSGCGKTTTLQMLAGFVEPTEGDILIDSRTLRGVPPHHRNIGVVFQSYALFPHLSILDNVAFGLRMRGVGKSEVAKRVKRALEIVQLTGLDQRYPRELSGGQQQRVALARAIVIEPAVLLLDEPLSNLDANLREQMRFEIREIQKRIGITTIFVTHDQNEAMAAADRLVVMNKGEIRQVGTAQEIYERPADLFVARFIGQANLLRGRVAAVRDSEAELCLASGERILARHNGAMAVGEAAALALRPEDLRVAGQAQAGMNNFAATITSLSYLGASTHASLRAGGDAFTVLAPRGVTVGREGDAVFVYWPSSAGILLRE